MLMIIENKYLFLLHKHVHTLFMRKLDQYDVLNFVSAHKEWMGLTL